MVNKILGYILIAAGVILALFSYPQFRAPLKIPIPANVTDNYILIAGAIVLIVGAFLAFNKSSKQLKEVPIYHGKNIVGFRRMGK